MEGGRMESKNKKTVFAIGFVVLAMGLFVQISAEQLTLEQVIREVCTKSDSAKMMKESVVKSNMLVRENKSAAYPKLSLNSNLNYSSPYQEEEVATIPDAALDMPLTMRSMFGMIGGFATPKSSTTYTGSLNLSVPIYTFGKIGSAIKVAETYNKSARTFHSRNIQTLQLSALDMFYRTMIAMESAQIAEKTLGRKTMLFEFIERNFNLGSGIKAQLLMAKSDRFGQSALVITAKQNAESARMFLNAFLGRTLTDNWTIDTSAIPPSLTKRDLILTAEAISQSADQRSDIQSIRLMAESNRNGAKIYKSMQYPSIFGSGSTGYTQIDSKGLFAREGAFDWSAGISFNWTLFDGFSSSSKAAQFLSDARKLEVAVGAMKKAAEIEIRTAESECGAADSSLAATEEMFNAATEAYELTYSNIQQGSGNLTEIQKVDEQLQMSEFGLLNARYRQIRSRAALLVAMGQDIVKVE